MPDAPQGTETEKNPSDQPSPATQDKSTQTVVINDPDALVNAHERVKAENRDLKQTLQEMTAKLSTIETTAWTD